MSDVAHISLDTTKIKKAVQACIPLSITTYTLPHEMEVYMSDILTAFLKELNQEQMTEYLVYCLNELATNAKKANTKRVYFIEKHLDINNVQDYEEGMKTFKIDTLENIKYYLGLQKSAGYYIKFIVQTKNNKIKIEIRNNSTLTFFEYKRIHDKLARAQQYSSVDDAFSQILDDSEGAGLGLIIMILMLKKIGLTEDNFQVICEKGETIERIILPLGEENHQKMLELSKELVNIIETLPQFPENIAHINRLLNNPDSKLSDIASTISNDVGLTADLLKLVNSASYGLVNPCRSISEAVKLVGLRGIKNLLFSIGSIVSLGDSTDEKKKLWEHSYKVAFYAYNLSRNYFNSERDVLEDSYVCGLLHDMGKVVFDTAHPQLLEKFKKMCQEKKINEQMFEKTVAGMNHAEIGAQIADKWHFPEVIVESIRYHHEPDSAPEKMQKLTSVVYFANMIAHYQEGSIDFYQIDPEICRMFRIKNEDSLKIISSRLEKAFTKER